MPKIIKRSLAANNCTLRRNSEEETILMIPKKCVKICLTVVLALVVLTYIFTYDPSYDVLPSAKLQPEELKTPNGKLQF